MVYIVAGRSERELEVLNEKLTSELNERTALAAKLTEQLQCSQSELNQLKSELTKVSGPVFIICQNANYTIRTVRESICRIADFSTGIPCPIFTQLLQRYRGMCVPNGSGSSSQKFQVLPSRTKRYQSFINFGLLHYQ